MILIFVALVPDQTLQSQLASITRSFGRSMFRIFESSKIWFFDSATTSAIFFAYSIFRTSKYAKLVFNLTWVLHCRHSHQLNRLSRSLCLDDRALLGLPSLVDLVLCSLGLLLGDLLALDGLQIFLHEG